MTSSSGPRLTPRARSSNAGAMLPLAIAVLPLVVVAVSRVLYPYDLGHYEAGTWEPARLLWSGSNPYGMTRGLQPPYVMAPYGPAYYAVVGLGLRLFGPQLWFGRVVALVSIGLAAMAVTILAQRFGGRGAGPLALLAFAAQLPFETWISVHRPDALALVLALTAVTAATRPSASARAIAGAAVAAALAALVRPTVVVPAFAVPLWFLLAGRRRAAVAFVVLLAGLLAVPIVGLQHTSEGGYAWQQFVLPASMGFSRDQIAVLAALFARHVGTWIVIGLAAVALIRRRGPRIAPDVADEPGRRFAIVLAAALGLATLVALLTSARRGSNVNYWLEPSALLAIAVALAWRRAAARDARPGYVLALWALALGMCVDGVTSIHAEAARWRARPYFDAIVSTLRDVEPREAPVLSMYPELAVYAGRSYLFNDGIQYDGRSEPHHALLVRTLRERRCAALVLPYARGPEGYARMALGDDSTGVYLFLRRDDR